MNVMCVKWGTKYSAEFVNKLYSMVKRNLDVDFTFYCYTEDPSGIRPEVRCIPIQSDLEKWWLKIDLLNIFTTDTNILLDLDIVILNKLQKLVDFKPTSLSVLWTSWKNGMAVPCMTDHYQTMFNSSVMVWSGEQGVEAYNLFQRKKLDSLFKYKGVDRFLFNEKLTVNVLPDNLAYSYARGTNFLSDRKPGQLHTDYDICLFNEGADILNSADWVKNYWH